ncbi:2-hydroxychromene-2-carboxylate isomerase [Falsigemmobacter intermedius]|uniref:2-hydroxychromene-2-carboxylate isomerase n=1 Tax=Falsigemmobacter intermedius TaxID=1553448 RepID=UPI003F007FF0
MQIDYYFSPLSPWCYLAGTRLEDLAGRHGAGVRYIPVDPSALFARTGGKMLAERHPSRQDYRLQDLRRTAARENLPLTLHPAHFPTNPAPASYAIIAAAKAGGDVGGLVQSFLRACWAEERNIAEDEVIRDLLARHGFDPGLADKGLWTGAEVYERNLEQAVNAGVFGFPFYIVGEEKFWGQDRLADLEQYLSGMK